MVLLRSKFFREILKTVCLKSDRGTSLAVISDFNATKVPWDNVNALSVVSFACVHMNSYSSTHFLNK